MGGPGSGAKRGAGRGSRASSSWAKRGGSGTARRNFRYVKAANLKASRRRVLLPGALALLGVQHTLAGLMAMYPLALLRDYAAALGRAPRASCLVRTALLGLRAQRFPVAARLLRAKEKKNSPGNFPLA
eukprot:2425662-Pyramimonas_sp.AAC.1